MTREKGREVERDGKVGKGRGGERVEMILGSESFQNLRGTPFAIYDFGIYFMQKPLGGHPLRSVTVGSEVLQNLSGIPLAIYDFATFKVFHKADVLGTHTVSERKL